MAKINEFWQKNKILLIGIASGIVLIGLIIGLIIVVLPHDATQTLKNSSSDHQQSANGGSSEQLESVMSNSEGESSMLLNDSNPGSGTTMNSTPGGVGSSSKNVAKPSGSTSKPASSGNYLEYTKYNLDTYLTPVWKNNIVYNESIMFYPNAKTKQLDAAPLLYAPTKILSVRSADLQTEFKEGVDYIVESGKIKLTKNSNIYHWEYDDYYLKQPASVPIGSVSAPGRYVRYASGTEYAAMQLAVTYVHSGSWTGVTPKYAGTALKTTISKLKSKQKVNIVYYGDSIMTGCEATGMNKMDPYMPIFTEMVTAKLKEAYGYSNIQQFNTAEGGRETRWGLEQVHARVTNHNPDLVLIGFGMNDSGVPVSLAEYESNIRAMIKDVRDKNSKAEFVLVSTTIPNPDCAGWTNLQPKYKTALENIVKDTSGVTIVPMTDIHQYLLTKKRYGDMNGNGVNHPNDFLARIYGQAICQTLIQNLS